MSSHNDTPGHSGTTGRNGTSQSVRRLPKDQRTGRPVTAGRGARRSRGRRDDQASDIAEGPSTLLGGVGRFLGRVVTLIVLPLVLLLGLAAGVGYFRLAQGPVTLDFLTPHIEESINAGLVGYRVEVGQAVVALSNRSGFEIQLRDLKLLRGGGETLGSAPAAAIALDHGKLWSGVVAPARVDLIEPQLFLSYRQDKGLSLTIADAVASGSARGVRLQEDGKRGRVETITPPVPVEADRTNARQSGTDLAKLMTELSRGAQQGGSGGLKQIGFRDARVRLDIDGDRSLWQVPDIAIDLERRGLRSLVSGVARVASREGPFSISFRHDSGADTGGELTAAVRGLKPTTLALALPRLRLLRMSNVPLDTDVRLTFDGNGGVKAGNFAVELGRGRLFLPDVATLPFVLEAGLLRFGYDGVQRRLRMEPSTVRWGGSSLTLEGLAQPVKSPDGSVSEGEDWTFEVRSRGGRLVTTDLGVEPLVVKAWEMDGAFDWDKALLSIERFRLAAGAAEIQAEGEIDGSRSLTSSRLTARFGAMPVATLLGIWPEALAPETRTWVSQQTVRAGVRSGTFQLISGRYFSQPGLGQPLPGAAIRADPADGGGSQPYRLALGLEVEDVAVVLRDDLQPLTFPDVRVRLENDALEVTAASGQATFNSGGGSTKPVELREARFTAVGFSAGDTQAEVAFNFETDADGFESVLEHPGLQEHGVARPKLKNVRGDVSGDLKLQFSLDETVRDDMKISGKVALVNGAARDVMGSHDVEGAKLTFHLSNRAIDGSGDFLIGGVPAKMTWQRIFGAEPERQPPLRISANLDATDRKQLGLDSSEAIWGTVPVEVTLKRFDKPQPDIHLRADLSGAELALENLIWRKPPGRSAFLDADLVVGSKGVDIENLTVAGDDIALQGKARIDARNKLTSFDFPSFSLNLITQLSVSGRRGKDNIWKVSAKGNRYDGRGFFRSLFSVGRVRDGAAHSKPDQAGIDLDAAIETVIGFSDVNLRGLQMSMSKRSGRLTAFQAHGILDGGQPLAVEMRYPKREVRQLLADSTDAGQAFRLVGFYPNVTGGRVRLQVDLEGSGAAEQTGILWVENFEVLGDQVVSEVVSAGAEGPKGRRGQRRVERQKIPFELMRAPFSVGHGQFVLRDAALKGPLLGASLRGRVDYTRRQLDLGGTYVPLQALNNMFGAIPVLGQILSGPRGEGIFGVTFGIQGSMDRPEAIVNPLSPLAPGIFREIFQLTPHDPRVQPRQDRPVVPRSGSRQGLGESWSTRTLEGTD